ncbi:protein kinase family protein [Klebsiella aerogenes]
MSGQSISSLLKANKWIDTNVGKFDFIKEIGEGGNSNVFLFSNSGHDFAIKFLKPSGDHKKTNRFKDEFFCVSQMPSNQNIVQYYHLDKVVINDIDYFIIIMKPYDRSLKRDFANKESAEKYEGDVRKLFNHLFNGLKHIHSHGVIHRDLKPENIFIDSTSDSYVIGDFGISRFDDEFFARLSQTKETERMANYKFSAPEQSSLSHDVTVRSDIYALGQIMQYFGTGDVSKGGGRERLLYCSSSEFLAILDEIIGKCIMHNPNDRFSSLDEIKEYYESKLESNKRVRDSQSRQIEESQRWEFLRGFDDAIVRSVPNINRVEKITSDLDIALFLSSIDSTISTDNTKDSLWMIMSDGGDLNYYGAKLIKDKFYEVNYGGFPTEMNIDSIEVYYDSHYHHKNFFIVITSNMPAYAFEDITDLSKKKSRNDITSNEDHCVAWNGYCLDPDDVRNKYVKIEGVTYSVNSQEFRDITRVITRDAFLIVPVGTPSSHMHDRSVATDLINACLTNPNGLVTADVDLYLNRIRGHYQSWIRNSL